MFALPYFPFTIALITVIFMLQPGVSRRIAHIIKFLHGRKTTVKYNMLVNIDSAVATCSLPGKTKNSFSERELIKHTIQQGANYE